ncbi:hypothetical protein Cgig2_033918 [Carnegiea gigantea]|uniref:Uncharacterized protein n=1 Tax=Carnegiea gigantea TaxID=171969 RepID=A0A9Q1JS56_9CARY|nr:hypothetical protein Cgig2_033918 [Carnegiea gigantea]
MKYEYNLYKKKDEEERRKNKGKRRGLYIGLSTILMTLLLKSLGFSIQGFRCLIPCTLTLARRSNKFHLLGVPAFILGLLALIYAVEPTSPRACVNIPRYRHGPADSLAPWLEPPFQPLRSLQPSPLLAASLAGAAAFSFSQRRWYRVTSPSSLRHSTATLTPGANASAIVTSSSVILGESEVPEVAKSQDLTKPWASENLAVGSTLMKLRLGVRSPVDRLLNYRGADRPAPACPAWVGADAAVSSGLPSIRWRLWTGKLTAGFFQCGTRWGAYGQNNLVRLLQTRDHEERGRVRHCLSSSRRRSASAVTCSGVASRSQRQSTSPSLALHKTKGKSGQSQTEKLTNIGMTNSLRKILKDQKAHCDKEKVVPKKFQLREFPITGLTLPLLRALHRFYRLSHKLGDGLGLIVFSYVELEITGHFSFLGRGLPKGLETFPQPDSRRTKRKSYIQCFIFDFCSMAVMNPDLHNLRRRLFILVQNLFNHRVKRKSETVVESRVINIYTFGGWLIHGGIHLRDYKGVPSRQECGNNLGIGKVTTRTVRAGWSPWELWSLRNNLWS